MSKMLTLEETAEYLNVAEVTVRRLFKGGDIKSYKVGKLWRTTKDDILMYLNRPREQKQSSRYDKPIKLILPEPVPIKYVNGRPHYI